MRKPAAVAPDSRRPRSDAVAVERPDDAAEPVQRRRPVGEPPRHGDTSPVGVDELELAAFEKAVARVRATEARLLRAAPARLAGAVGVRDVVRPDRPGLETLGQAARTRGVARPDGRAEAVAGVVRAAHRVLLVVERLDGHDRPEDLLPRKTI